jgi:hypothetical protein
MTTEMFSLDIHKQNTNAIHCTLIANFTRLIIGKRDDDVKYFKSWTCKQALATYIYWIVRWNNVCLKEYNGNITFDSVI